MERRLDIRLPADLSGSLARLSGPEERLPVTLEDISEGGMRFHTTEELARGCFVVLEVEDSTLFGEVRYCQAATSGYTVGVLVERVLAGNSDISHLIGTLLEAAY